MGKNIKFLRIGSLILILLFLMIPLLSSPVAATFTVNSNADTNNTVEGPTAWVTLPDGPYPIIVSDEGTRRGYFVLYYSFEDSTDVGDGSDHFAKITIQKTLPPSTAKTSNSIGPITLLPREKRTGSIQVTDRYFQVPTEWKVTLEVSCTPKGTGGDPAEDSGSFTVRVQ